MRDRGKYVIWPVYLDSTKTAKEGRRIARNVAVRSPQLEEIERAANELGMNPIVDVEAIHPRTRMSGYVLVDKRSPKLSIIKEIAMKVAELRRASGV